MESRDDLVERIAGILGIRPTYRDAFGKEVATPFEARRALLTGFGLSTDTSDEACGSLERVTRLRRGPVPPIVAVEAGRPIAIPFAGGEVGRIGWRIEDEAGQHREGHVELRHDWGQRFVDLPALPAGYFALALDLGASSVDATIVAAPPRCYRGDSNGHERLWGVTAPAWGIAAEDDFGFGDFSAIGHLAAAAGRAGAAFLGLSPLHALFAADRSKISPYSPSSRLFLETLHIDPAAVDGFADSVAAAVSEASCDAAEALRRRPLVDHEAAWALKRPVLEVLWTAFRAADPSPGFGAFLKQGGALLDGHATFEAIAEAERLRGRLWPGDWLPALRDRHSAEVAAFRATEGERVAFHAWLQWLADSQLASAAAGAAQAGMTVGLYRDLAVGADRHGSEVWAAPERFAGGLSIGAPPDPLAPQGQDWGLPPIDPLVLEADGLLAFRALVRSNMRHAGAIRIDHAFQLRRLFLIPAGVPAAHGAFVDYPFEGMLAVLRHESHRARCRVIAEDLGTAPWGFSDAIMEAGTYAYRVLYFERETDGAFKPPDSWTEDALAVITTHDLPTFAGWWEGRDIDLRVKLGIYDAAQAEAERLARAADRERLTALLAAQGLLPGGRPPVEAPFEPVARLLGRGSSALVSFQLEDVAGAKDPANVPGLTTEVPNWRRRLPLTTGDFAGPEGALARLGAAMDAENRGR